MLTLYFTPGACSLAAHIVLEESGEAYTPREVDFAHNEQRSEAYLKINPQGRVPVLGLDNGQPLAENTAILPYLGKRFGLWPTDALTEAKALSLIGFFAASVHPAHAHVSRPERYAADAAVFPALKTRGLETFHGYLKQIDGMLAGKDWFLDRYSVIDPYGLVFYTWGIRRELPMRDLKHYTAFKDRMRERPGVRRVLEQEKIPRVTSASAMAPAARLQGISKQFGATLALDGVDFDVEAAEIHAVVGENGAGKSTLIRILSGVHRPDRGQVIVGGVVRHFASPHDAIAAGVVTIPQELRLVPALSIAENIALGDLPVRRFGPLALLNRKRMDEEARAILAQLDFAPDVSRPVADLSFAERQLVAIGRALHRQCRIFILDEPTAALEQHEIERLFAVLARIKARGTAIVYISHELDEVVAIADRCTVLRDGRLVATTRRGAFSVDDLVSAMTGRSHETVDATPPMAGAPLVEADLGGAHPIRLRAGETIGVAGLLGSGTDILMRRLFGVVRDASPILVGSQSRRLRGPADAIAAGIGFVPGERALGLVLNQSVRDNILLASLDRLTRGALIDRAAGERIVAELVDLLDIRPRRPELPVSALSGGNQQKVILAKWLARRVHVLLLEEPTQGIDVGAKAQIHGLIRDFVRRGGGALIASTDLAELGRLCDAVLAVRQGSIVARLERADGLDEPTLRAAIGA